MLLLALSGLACSAFAGNSSPFLDAIAKAETPVVGKEYYARHCFMYEDGKHITTNYWRGTIVPINSRIKVEIITADKLLLRVVETGEGIEIDNIEKYTKCDMSGIARRMLSAKPIALGGFDDDLANAIKSGTLRKGMTKEQVLMARGFPPAHKTPTLTSDRWQYWSSRYAVHTVVFADDKLIDGRGIY